MSSKVSSEFENESKLTNENHPVTPGSANSERNMHSKIEDVKQDAENFFHAAKYGYEKGKEVVKDKAPEIINKFDKIKDHNSNENVSNIKEEAKRNVSAPNENNQNLKVKASLSNLKEKVKNPSIEEKYKKNEVDNQISNKINEKKDTVQSNSDKKGQTVKQEIKSELSNASITESPESKENMKYSRKISNPSQSRANEYREPKINLDNINKEKVDEKKEIPNDNQVGHSETEPKNSSAESKIINEGKMSNQNKTYEQMKNEGYRAGNPHSSKDLSKEKLIENSEASVKNPEIIKTPKKLDSNLKEVRKSIQEKQMDPDLDSKEIKETKKQVDLRRPTGRN
jgi:hypothetical protein